MSFGKPDNSVGGGFVARVPLPAETAATPAPNPEEGHAPQPETASTEAAASALHAEGQS